ncbi:MAG: protocatechuate 3,4-dioxygenase [Casimicrobium sp.]
MSNVTSSQTIGPFFHNALAWSYTQGHGAIELVGQVLDGNDQPINDALLEIWADNVSGETGFGLLRQPTDAEGRFSFHLPAPTTGAPLAHVCVFARGCFNHHFTAVFASAIDHPLLNAAPESRRSTLIATLRAPNRYEWILRLQGTKETVFFEYE